MNITSTSYTVLNESTMSINFMLLILMIIGVITCGINGAIRAIEEKMDITGAILLAFITANAGGTMRDIFLGTTIFWIKNNIYIWLTIASGSLTFLIIYFNRNFFNNKKLRQLLIITDSIGLAVFSLAGAEKAINLQETYLIVLFMGVCTAIGGGIAADIITNRIPSIFSKELYITTAFSGTLLYLVLHYYLNHTTSCIISIFFIIILRLLSIKFNWKLPIIN